MFIFTLKDKMIKALTKHAHIDKENIILPGNKQQVLKVKKKKNFIEKINW